MNSQQPPNPTPPRWISRNSLIFAVGMALLTGLMFLATVRTGRAMLLSGHVWPSDILFGLDVQRNIRDISEPGHNARSNAHPLFAAFTKPFSYVIQAVGVTPGISAIILNAMAGALGLLITACYLRLRGAGWMDVWLMCALLAGSTTFIVESSLPGTYIFSFCMLGLANLLLYWQLARPDPLPSHPLNLARETGWLVTGILNYGFTVTNGFMSFMTYGLGRSGLRGWIRAAIYGATVLVLGLGLSWILGSSLDILLERRWLYANPLRGPDNPHPFFHAFSTFLAWSFVAPAPNIGTSLDERHWTVASFQSWNYDSWGWILVATWLVLLGFALVCASMQRDCLNRRLNLALLASFLFHAIGHSFFYVSWEGVFGFSGHSLFLVIGLFAPLLAGMEKLPPAARWILRATMLALALALIQRHFTLLTHLRESLPLPEGYGPSA